MGNGNWNGLSSIHLIIAYSPCDCGFFLNTTVSSHSLKKCIMVNQHVSVKVDGVFALRWTGYLLGVYFNYSLCVLSTPAVSPQWNCLGASVQNNEWC